MSIELSKDSKVCIIFGKTGVGKSSFINAITAITDTSDQLEVSDKGKACTIDFEIRESKLHNKIFFVDTPGLLDMKGDENNEAKIQHALSEYNICKIIILLKFQDVRLDGPVVNMLQSYMEFLPIKDFWENVIIVYTNAKKKDEDFEEDKKKVEGKIIKSLDYDDFRSFKQFMLNKGIKLPKKLKEFYCDCRNKKGRDQEYNKDEFDSIFDLIEKSQPIIMKIENKDEKIIQDKQNGLQYYIIKRITKYITNSGQEIKKEFELKKEELSKYKVEKENNWKEQQYVSKKCRGKKKIYYHYYKQKLYRIDKEKTLWGEKCKYGEGWENY